jgi:DNA polymerase-3 subunit gamma/tau
MPAATPEPEPEPAPEAPSGPSPRERAQAAVAEEQATTVAPEADVASEDDPDVDDSGLSGLALVQRELGGQVMTEYDNG